MFGGPRSSPYLRLLTKRGVQKQAAGREGVGLEVGGGLAGREGSEPGAPGVSEVGRRRDKGYLIQGDRQAGDGRAPHAVVPQSLQLLPGVRLPNSRGPCPKTFPRLLH